MLIYLGLTTPFGKMYAKDYKPLSLNSVFKEGAMSRKIKHC